MTANAKNQRTCVLKCTDHKHMHAFPKDEIGRNVWLKQLGIKHANATSCVCDRHFSKKMKATETGIKLTPWAIPDINLPEYDDRNDSSEDISEEESSVNVKSSEVHLNGYSTTEKSATNDEEVDFDELLAQVHHISDFNQPNDNNKENETASVGDGLDLDYDFDSSNDNDYSSSPNSTSDNIRNDFRVEEDTLSAPPTPVEINSKFKRKLIASVRRRRILYDPAHPSFSNIEKKTRSWERIGKVLKLDATACRELWLNMRYEYQNHVRALRQWLAGESCQRERPRISFENDLLFLWRFIGDKSYCEDLDDETRQSQSIICPIPGIPDATSVNLKDVTVIANDYARSVDHAYANNKTDESLQFTSNLVEAVKPYSELYDHIHPNYGDAKRKSLIWEAISNELNEKATKCLFTWIQLQLRYEFELMLGKSSYLVNMLDFLRKHIITNEKSPYKRATLLSNEWYEPMNTSKEQHLLVQTIIAMKKFRPFFLTIDAPAKGQHTPCWIAVARSLKRKPEQCEVTWIIMQAMFCEVFELSRNGCPLRDEWEFESIISNLRNNVMKNSKNYAKDIAEKPKKNNPTSELCEDHGDGMATNPPPNESHNEITFEIPAQTPGGSPQLVRFHLDTPLAELPDKTIVEIESVLENAHIVILKQWKKPPAIFLFSLEKRKELMAEVMARPILFNEPCKQSRLSRIFWGEISVELGYPVEVCMYFWDYIVEKSYFVDYDPSFKTFAVSKWIQPPNPIFEKFQKYADAKKWGEYVSDLPDFIQEISNFPLIYVDLKVNSSWNRRQCHSRDIAEVWTILARKFAELENHKVIWDKFKQVFLLYMTEMEISIYNAWPKFWSRVLAKMTFLCDLRYDPKDPIYYVIKNKIQEELKEVEKQNKPLIPKLDPFTNAKAIFRLLKENEYLEDFSWVNRSRFVAKMKCFPMLYDINHPLFGNKAAKLDAWQEMALSFHCTVGECHLIFQHLMKSFLLFRARDPNQLCRVNAKYWENMTYIYSLAVPNAVDPTTMQGRSFRSASNGSTIKLAEEYQAEITLVDAKPRLLLKNFAAAVNSLPIQIQTSVVQQIKYIFAEYTRIQNEEIVVDI